jgi:hypothetical protein
MVLGRAKLEENGGGKKTAQVKNFGFNPIF